MSGLEDTFGSGYQQIIIGFVVCLSLVRFGVVLKQTVT